MQLNRSPEKKDTPRPFAVAALSGAIGGVVAPAIFHPLDLIRTRLSAQGYWKVDHVGEKYTGMIDAVRKIVGHEKLRGMYRGVTAAMLGSGLSWGVYMPTYNLLQKHIGGSPTGNFTAGSLAGVVQVMVTNPIWLIKTRMQLQQNSNEYKHARNTPIYSGVFNGLRTVWVEEGIRGMYRGVSPGLLLTSHGGVQFAVIEEVKKILQTFHKTGEKLPGREIFFASAVGKIIATITLHPILVIRVRLQDEANAAAVTTYRGLVDCAKKIFRHEGIFGFWKGLLPNMIKAVPVSATAITVADLVGNFLTKQI